MTHDSRDQKVCSAFLQYELCDSRQHLRPPQPVDLTLHQAAAVGDQQFAILYGDRFTGSNLKPASHTEFLTGPQSEVLLGVSDERKSGTTAISVRNSLGHTGKEVLDERFGNEGRAFARLLRRHIARGQ